MPKNRAAEGSVDDEQVQGTKLATDSQAAGSGMAALAAVDTVRVCVVFVVAIVIVLVASALIVRIRNVKRHVPFIITLPRPATFASPAFSRMVLVGFHCCRMAAAAVHADDVAYDGHEYMKGRCVA